MDFMTPPIFDILNLQTWKAKMSIYVKALGIYVYFTTIKDSYFLNSKNLEANAKVIHALKSTLNDDYLCRVANLDSAFVVWNTIISLDEQEQYYAGRTRMMEVMPPIYAAWYKEITPLRYILNPSLMRMLTCLMMILLHFVNNFLKDMNC